eukprot:scaffold16916_cov49-Phaeocystis_antarctica.AAC.8
MPRGSRRPARGSQGERLLPTALASHGFSRPLKASHGFSRLGGAVVGPCDGEAPGREGGSQGLEAMSSHAKQAPREASAHPRWLKA